MDSRLPQQLLGARLWAKSDLTVARTATKQDQRSNKKPSAIRFGLLLLIVLLGRAAQ